MAAQNVFDKPNGAFTGEISAEQLKDSGIGWALVGHSERRVILGEDDGVSLERKGLAKGTTSGIEIKESSREGSRETFAKRVR